MKRKVTAIVAAGGKGERLPLSFNKVFLPLGKETVLYHSLNALEAHNEINDIVLVLQKEDYPLYEKLIVERHDFQKITLVEGGETRQSSIFKGLRAVSDASLVLTHDGARPLITPVLISAVIKGAEEYGACAIGTPVTDTIRRVFNERTQLIERDEYWFIQTPQCFDYDLFWKAHNRANEMNKIFTDDSGLVESFGHSVKIISSSSDNIKITYLRDLYVAEQIMKGELK